MYLILQEWSRLEARLTISLADSSVKVPLNLHLDDSSMVASKMWKSGSVVGIQASEISFLFSGQEILLPFSEHE